MLEPQEQLFLSIVDEIVATYKKKNSDYGNTFEDLFSEFGMVYAYAHMKEKLMRIRSLMYKSPEVRDESIKDSLKDLASYSILTLAQILNSQNSHEQ